MTSYDVFRAASGCTFIALIAGGDGGQNRALHKRNKHITTQYHFNWEKMEGGEMALERHTNLLVIIFAKGTYKHTFDISCLCHGVVCRC